MWPQWAYLLCGVGFAWLFIVVVGLLFWLYEEHEEIFAAILVTSLLTALGLVFGQLAYDNAVKKAKAPHPPAEASP